MCWLEGSMFLRDAAFDFFAECFHSASDSFDYFSFVRFGPLEITRLIEELATFTGSLKCGTSTREELFSRYASLVTKEIWADVPTKALTSAVVRTGEELGTFVRERTEETKCLWVLGM